MCNLLYNPGINVYISVREKTVQPKGYVVLTDKELQHPAIQRHLKAGTLEMKPPDDIQLSVAERVMRHIDTAGSLVLERAVAFGDVILCSPLFKAIKMKYPQLTLHFNTSKEALPLVWYNPYVEASADLGVMRQKISNRGSFISLNNIPEQYEYNNWPDISLNRIEIMCEYLDVECLGACPEYYTSEPMALLGEQFVSKYPRPFIGVGPVSRRKEKMWPMERWTHLAALLHSKVGGTVFSFHPREVVSGNNVVALVHHGMSSAAAIAMQMDCFVTLDSLWTHMAAAMNIPQVLLASCTDGELLSKEYPSVRVLHGQEACYPCWYRFAAGGCEIGQHPRCLGGVSPGDVCSAVEEQLDAA